MTVQVTIHTATLTIEEQTVKLTKGIAKQFPVLPLTTRWDEIVAGTPREPICKVNGEALGKTAQWYYLVQDDAAGLAWVEPIVRNDILKGYDDLAEVPTVVLI